jgi:hypothetical protein
VRALTWREPGVLERLLRRKPKRPATHVRERQYHFDPRVLQLRGDVYLDGNWNSPKYFEDVAPLIRQEFTFRQPATGRNRELLAAIDAVNAVSVHVRRGDYIADPKVASIHGTCGLDYYRACLDLIAERIRDPHFFLFSDDPQWVREHLSLKWPSTVVDHNGPLDGHEDMRLMSCCRHHIIANSGFSWWAAWLNPNPDKIVLAPRQWFSTTKHDTRDLIPAGWIRL